MTIVSKWLDHWFGSYGILKSLARNSGASARGERFTGPGRTIVFKINRLESALAISKISFLRKFEKSYTCKRNFFVQTKNTCLFIVDKEPKKIILFKSATSTVKLIWNDICLHKNWSIMYIYRVYWKWVHTVHIFTRTSFFDVQVRCTFCSRFL